MGDKLSSATTKSCGTKHRLADFFEHLLQGVSTGDGIPINKTRTDKDSLETETVQVTVQIFVRQDFADFSKLRKVKLESYRNRYVSDRSFRKT